ncbi:hypothetical protein CQW23_01920 [Capsicum baccatum]|uniref:DUF1985 domain-containing protein n=1 Tax=Capsicum baccatum TaxID=33114 RepID=A0A2G2XPZ1_CAPBA|nr:hypothetical protein CQW23_01920 [Capsicum baccatum]
MSLELKTSSTDAILMRFNENTIRFTLRDFAIISGQNCVAFKGDFVFETSVMNRLIQTYFDGEEEPYKAMLFQAFKDKVNETKVDCVEGDHSHVDIQHDLQIIVVHTDVSSHLLDQKLMFAVSVHMKDPIEIEHPKLIQDVRETWCTFPDKLLPSLNTERRIIDMYRRKLTGETPKLPQRTQKPGKARGYCCDDVDTRQAIPEVDYDDDAPDEDSYDEL